MRDIRYGFNAGERGPEFRGRADIERYDLSAARIENFYVNYSGSLMKRPGLEFIGVINSSDLRLYSARISGVVYVFVFTGDGKIRFFSGDAYLIEADVAVTGIFDGTVTAPGHGYSVGDLVQIENYGREVLVSAVTTNTFDVTEVNGDPAFIFAGATVANKVFTIAHPYSAAELENINFDQTYDVIKITCNTHPPQLLQRPGGNWELVEETRDGGAPLSGGISAVSSGKFIKSVRVTAKGSGYSDATTLVVTATTGEGAVLTPVIQGGEIVGVTIVEGGRNYTGVTITPANTGGGTGAAFEVTLSAVDAEVVFSVSAVIDGKETGIFRPKHRLNIPDFTQVRATITYRWPTVPGADEYNVYRSYVFPFEGQAHIGNDLFYIGTVRGNSMTEANITPDATRTPKLFSDPFAAGAITNVRVTASGSGYTKDSTITVTDAEGSGAILYPIVLDDEVIGVYIAHGGQNYVSPTLTISDGTGATLVTTLSSATGNYPATSATFQNRAIYAGTGDNSQRIYGSKLKEFDNFAVSRIITSDDPYIYDVDFETVTSIQHVLPVKQGLMVFLEEFVGILRGADGQAVTQLNGVFDTISYQGSTNVPPIFVEEDIVYVANKKRSLMLIAAARQDNRGFETREISFLSRDIFRNRDIISLAPSVQENNLLYGALSDGEGFIGTIHREQETFAFTRMKTRGDIKAVASVDVNDGYCIYCVVNRDGINYVTKAATNRSRYTEDRIHLDFSLTTPKIRPDAKLALSGKEGEITVSASTFTSGDVGKMLGGGGGRGIITAVNGANATVTVLNKFLDLRGGDMGDVLFLNSGEWYLNPILSTVENIPLELETVDIIGDGKYLGQAIVTNGAITLPAPAAIVTVGLAYSASVQLSPPAASIARNRKNVAARVHLNAVGELRVREEGGSDLILPARFSEPWAAANAAEERIAEITLRTEQRTSNDVIISSTDGLPCEITLTAVYYNENPQAYDTDGDDA